MGTLNVFADFWRVSAPGVRALAASLPRRRINAVVATVRAKKRKPPMKGLRT
jgi:hypothetical protein